jgi:hypothetical protein
MLGNPAAIKRAVKDTIPNHDQEQKRRAKLTSDLASIKSSRERIVRAIGKGILSEEDATSELTALKEREGLLRQDLARLDEALASIPTEEEMNVYVERIARVRGIPGLTKVIDANGNLVDGVPDAISVIDGDTGDFLPGGNDLSTWLDMSWEDKRSLIEAVFKDTTVGNRPAGVYFHPLGSTTARQPKQWTYKVMGHLDFETSWLCNSGRSSKLAPHDQGHIAVQTSDVHILNQRGNTLIE